MAERPRSAAGAEPPPTGVWTTEPCTTAVPPSAVGRDRTHSRTVSSHPPRCHRACGFHRTRRPPMRPFTLVSFLTTLVGIPLPSHSSGSYVEAPHTLWPFPLWTAFPSSEYYGHADSSPGHWRIWGGLLRPYFRSPCHPVGGLPCSQLWTLQDSLGGGYRTLPSPYWRSRPCWGSSRSVPAPISSITGLWMIGALGALQPLQSIGRCPRREDRAGDHFPVGENPLHWNSPSCPLAKHSLLRPYLSRTAPFRGMLFTRQSVL